MSLYKKLVYSLLLVMAMTAAPAFASKKVALVIGNDHYENVPGLQKAVSDASTISDVLRQRGFDVIQAHNLGRRATNQKLHQFISTVEADDVAMFYYAGHGVEINGQNYLLPVDVPAAEPGQEGFVTSESIGLTNVLWRLRAKHARLNIVVLDACRNNPFINENQRGVGGTRGLAAVTPPEGTFILYSADAGQSALDALSDDDANPNSVFTRVLAPMMLKEDIHLASLARNVRRQVKQLAGSVQHKQTPAYYDAVLGDFYFTRKKKAEAEPVVETIEIKKDQRKRGGADASLELAFWQDVKDSGNVAFLNSYIRQYPDGKFVYLAKAKIDLLKQADASARVKENKSPVKVVPKPSNLAPVESNQNTLAAVQVEPVTMAPVKDTGFALKPVEDEKPALVPLGPDIDRCRTHFKENRLTTGAGGNAYDCYIEILALNPDDAAARAGLQEIEDRYSGWVATYAQRGELDRARGTLEKLKAVNPENEKLPELSAMLKSEHLETSQPVQQAPISEGDSAETEILIAGRYRDNGNGTVTDTDTGLQWMRCSLGQTWNGSTCSGQPEKFALQMREYNAKVNLAERAAKKNRTGEYSDWRVPTRRELLTLVYCSSGQPAAWNKSGKICSGKFRKPTIDVEAFPATPALNYWTSTPHSAQEFGAWYVSFISGYSHTLKRDGQLSVRLVRNRQ